MTSSLRRRRAAPPGSRAVSLCSPLLVLALLLFARPAAGAVTLRHSADQRGDVVLFGNTLGYDCGPDIPRPLVGTVASECGLATTDTAMDVFFRAADDGASASLAVRPADARTTAVLELPPGARVTYARLYWASQVSVGSPPSPFALLDRPGRPAVPLTADSTRVVNGDPVRRPNLDYYQHSADITIIARDLGPGAYRVGGVASVDLANLDDAVVFAAWSVVVFYALPGDPPRNLTLFDGLELVAPGSDARATLSGFLVPGLTAKSHLGVVAYEGDQSSPGDSLFFGDAPLGDAQNPASNFFNASRSRLGANESIAGDLPRLSGAPASMNGLDLDLVDVTPLLKPGQSRIDLRATSEEDVFFIGALVTSISTSLAGLSVDKTWQNATLPGETRVRPGDAIAFTLRLRHDGAGDEPLQQVQVRDALPKELAYIHGTLALVEGAGAGPRSDDAGDDEAEYDAATRTLTFRAGAGASAKAGGVLKKGESVAVRFLARVLDDVRGQVQNQAVASAAPERGGVVADFPSNRVALQLCDPSQLDCGAVTRFAGGGAPQGCVAAPAAPGASSVLALAVLALALTQRRRRESRRP